jgi:hypothetical protein
MQKRTMGFETFIAEGVDTRRNADDGQDSAAGRPNTAEVEN